MKITYRGVEYDYNPRNFRGGDLSRRRYPLQNRQESACAAAQLGSGISRRCLSHG